MGFDGGLEMPEKAELGKRIKKTREEKHLTLKSIEASAGISATHISEIERGKTSPTLGALLRISNALGKDPAYFLEDEDLGDVSVVTTENRSRGPLPGNAGTLEQLTTCIPGGRLQACIVKLDPGKTPRVEKHSHFGNEAALVLSGSIRFEIGEKTIELGEGDAIHYHSTEAHRYENASKQDGASVIWLSTVRDAD
jgi:transcriptional regulator with XRE-family HTH domain